MKFCLLKAGQHAFAQVTIEVSDVNDNRPEFHPTMYFANIPATTSVVGYPVARVSATDADDSSTGGSGFGVITYEILSGNEQGLFAFDNKTGRFRGICYCFLFLKRLFFSGEISIARPLVAFGNTVIHLRIRAIDGGDKSTDTDADVKISIINTTIASIGGPVFNQSHYSWNVAESASPGEVIGKTFASATGTTADHSVLLRSLRAILSFNFFIVSYDSAR